MINDFITKTLGFYHFMVDASHKMINKLSENVSMLLT